MSDYLTRAVESIRPNPAAIRPRLPTLFETPAAEPTPEILSNENKRELPETAPRDETAPLRQRIEVVETAANISSPVLPKPNILAADRAMTRITPEQKQTTAAQPASSSANPLPPKAAAPAPEAREPKKAERQNSKPPQVTVLPRIARPNFLPGKTIEPPAIHVTIGRIEVRATSPATPPSPKPQPQSAPRMSLDDYLRKRNGGRA